MEKTTSKLTILFEEPFWIGVYERESCGEYEASKVVFGAEPKDSEVYSYFLKNVGKLEFSQSMETNGICERHVNPKRRQREVNAELQSTGIGTKAQQALKSQQQQRKLERRIYSREERDAKEEQKFAQKQQKRKEKHKGH